MKESTIKELIRLSKTLIISGTRKKNIRITHYMKRFYLFNYNYKKVLNIEEITLDEFNILLEKAKERLRRLNREELINEKISIN